MPRASRLFPVLAIALVAAAVEIAVMHNAMGLSLSHVMPASLRVQFNGSDARTNATIASELLASASPANARAAQDYARRALLRDPLVAEAARNAGAAAGLLGHPDAMKRRLDYSLWLSRRDLPTLLGQIEERVGANDIAGALHFYDIALRASGNAGTVLVPVLVQAVEDATVRAELIAYIARYRPPWTQTYFDALLRTSRDWQALAAVTRGLLEARVPLARDTTDQAIRTVVDAGHPAEAYGMYLAKAGTIGRQALRNGNFTSFEGTSPFDWNLMQDAGRQAAMVDGQLSIDVVRDTNGPVAHQLLMLRPGHYRLQAKLAVEGEPDNALPYWVVVCLPRNVGIGRVEASRLLDGGNGWSGEFTISPDCEAQKLILNVRAMDTAITYKVSDVSVDAMR